MIAREASLQSGKAKKGEKRRLLTKRPISRGVDKKWQEGINEKGPQG